MRPQPLPSWPRWASRGNYWPPTGTGRCKHQVQESPGNQAMKKVEQKTKDSSGWVFCRDPMPQAGRAITVSLLKFTQQVEVVWAFSVFPVCSMQKLHQQLDGRDRYTRCSSNLFLQSGTGQGESHRTHRRYRRSISPSLPPYPSSPTLAYSIPRCTLH